MNVQIVDREFGLSQPLSGLQAKISGIHASTRRYGLHCDMYSQVATWQPLVIGTVLLAAVMVGIYRTQW